MRFKSCGVALLLAGLAAGASGEEVKVSSFGFDPEDSTRFLQAALDSGAKRVVVDRQAGPWITTPLFGRRSDQEIVFERGVELRAKKGAFRGRNDCLMRLTSVTNVTVRGYGATWRMHRADYDAAPYAKGEWRHSLSILSAVNVTVEGLTFVESGGDGVYVADDGRTCRPCRNVVLRDLVCDRQYRQGISVITVDGLLVERCRMVNTFGTPPAAGIDFEPNAAHEELSGIVVRDCEFGNNQGYGFEFYLGQLDASSRPIDAVFENCRSYGNRGGFWLGNGKKPTFVTGSVELRKCTVENEKGAAVTLVRKPKTSVRVAFRKCVFSNCGSEVELHTKFFGDAPVEGFAFDDCTFKAPVERPRIVRKGASLNASDLPEAKPFDPAGARPFDNAPGRAVRLAAVRLRCNARYRFHAADRGRVEFSGRVIPLGRSRVPGNPLRVRDASGAVIATVPCPKAKADTPFAVEVPAGGFYLLEADVGNHAFELTASSAPVAVEVSGAPQSILASTAKMGFRVSGSSAVALGFAGADKVERVHATVRDPSGRVMFDKDRILDWEIYRTPDDAAQGLWSVELSPPADSPYEDNYLAILGGQPELFLTEEKGW